MSKKILERLRTFREEVKLEQAKNISRFDFEVALSNLDIETIKNMVSKGFSIKDYEENNKSTLTEAIKRHFDYMLNRLKKYFPDTINDFYFYELPKLKRNDIPLEILSEIDNSNRLLLEILNVLYNNGANINHNFMINQNEKLLPKSQKNRTRIVQVYTPLQQASVFINLYKTNDIISWFLEKKDLNIEVILNDANKKYIISKMLNVYSEEQRTNFMNRFNLTDEILENENIAIK